MHKHSDQIGCIRISAYLALDRQLDSLNSALDAIDQKNDDIHGKLKAILKENKEAREALQQGPGKETEKGTDAQPS